MVQNNVRFKNRSASADRFFYKTPSDPSALYTPSTPYFIALIFFIIRDLMRAAAFFFKIFFDTALSTF